MNKVTRILLALGLILAVAAPAFAEFKLNGYYRLMGYSGEVLDTTADNDSGTDEGRSRQIVDQRMRLKATYTLNENVAVVYQAEIDSTWGSMNGTTNGAQVGADSVNVETKSAYLDLKYGDTTVALGVQGMADDFQSVVINDDMAGIYATHKLGDAMLKAYYAKWYENDQSNWDDTDFYGLAGNYKFNDNFKAGAAVYYFDSNQTGIFRTLNYRGPFGAVADPTIQDSEIYFYGVNAAATFGIFNIDGFAIMQDGTIHTTSGNNDVEVKGHAASVKGAMKLESGDIGLRLMYFSAAEEDDEFGAWTGFGDQYEFVNENQMIFLVDPYVMNYGKERYAMNFGATAGYGLMGAVLSGNHKLPQDMYLKWGAGYYQTVEDTAFDDETTKVEGETLGYELCARVGKKFFDKVDLSLNAAYADFGDFFDDLATDDGGDLSDPDSIYKVYVMVNVPF